MLKRLAIFATLLVTTTSVFAGPTLATVITIPGGSETQTQNRAYAGLVWTLQEKTSVIPDLTIGFRSLRVKSSNSVQGGDISARFKLKNGISFDSTRLSFVGGERDVLGNIGIGYSIANSSFLGTLAVQGAYSRIGSDFEFANKKFVPYLEVLTLDKPSKVHSRSGSTSYVCPTGLVYLGNTYQGAPLCDTISPP